MNEDRNGTSNLIAFPVRTSTDGRTDVHDPANLRDRDLIKRLETIAEVIGVPVSAFLGAARERAVGAEPVPAEAGSARALESAELLRLFGRISDGATRDQYLNLLRALAAGERA